MENGLIESVTFQNLTFAKVVSGTFFDINNLRGYDAVIIEYTNKMAVLDLMGSIRSHEDQAIYLLPVFFYRFYRESNKEMREFADGTVNDLQNLEAAANQINEINERV